MNVDTETRTSIHEAGHGVACWSVGIRPALISIIPRHEFRGEFHYPSMDGHDPQDLWFQKKLIISFGGAVAEYLLLESGPDTGGASRDFRDAHELIRWLGYLSDSPSYIDWHFFFQVLRALDTGIFKSAIAGLADRLLIGRELKNQEIVQAIEDGVNGKISGEVSLFYRLAELQKQFERIGRT